MQPLQQIEHTASRGFVQIACRFVSQKQSWATYQRSGERHPLLLAAGELPGPMIAAIFQIYLSKPIRCNSQRLSSRLPTGQQRHSYVF